MLSGDNLALQLGLKTCGQAAICSLKIFNLIFREQFAKTDFDRKIELAQKPF
jgi:hypothetical protein